MQTTTLRVSEPQEILALVPHRLGFRPRDSAVAVSLRPPRGAVGLVVRVDLPHLADPTDGPLLARTLVAHLGRDGARRGILVLYTDRDPRGEEGPAQMAARHVREAAQDALGDVLAWVVTPTGYLSLDCVEDCCPPGGRPLRDLDSTQVGATLVLAGSAVADSREDIARIRPQRADVRRSAARVRRRWEDRCAQAVVAGDDAVGRWREDSLAAWRQAVAIVGAGQPGSGGSPWGRIEAGLTDRRVRDGVLVALVPGTADLPERCVRTVPSTPELDAALGGAMALILDPRRGVVPPAHATAVHEAVLEAVVARGRTGAQAPALTLLALLAWWRGDGARARLLLDGALDADAEYHLAELLDDALTAAIPPGWVRHSD
ncbi:DUF4192 domain-containing protein [Cellulomonas sp. Leaf334]|uniref:DUF4192 domain-containing protein n=1 Tax=Cellulomonas sp. Leaf334 TaxID=1736339 RepID=UPI0006FA9C9B|nr:DUF4192 domain-containing protein [Cellulomonas sp. Leaf334]KQR16367.1 hypothetical protein ASF78_02950 [Cellulomonas sp. Leaf334]